MEDTSATQASVSPQHGLEWKCHVFWGPEPEWAVEPDITVLAKIARQVLAVAEDTPCSIEFLGGGAFNKVYIVHYSDKSDKVIRVVLPVQPKLKTMSEHATMAYLRQHTDMPIPRVLAYEATNQNELQFEWMVMDRVLGAPLENKWKDLTWLKKELIVRRVAHYQAQMFLRRFNRIGNLYQNIDLHSASGLGNTDACATVDGMYHVSPVYSLGDIVSIPYFWGCHLQINASRGPFNTSQEWIATLLQLLLADAQHAVDNPESDDEDGDEEKKRWKESVERLTKLLPMCFPMDETEEFVLHHQDLAGRNILLNDKDELAGIIDWECVHTTPLWFACQSPKFLESRDRSECPDPDNYMFSKNEDGTKKVNELFYKHLEEYEKFQLRKFFFEEMERLCPEWMKVHRESSIKVDFERSIDYCPLRRNITDWLDKLESGKVPYSLIALDREVV